MWIHGGSNLLGISGLDVGHKPWVYNLEDKEVGVLIYASIFDIFFFEDT